MRYVFTIPGLFFTVMLFGGCGSDSGTDCPSSNSALFFAGNLNGQCVRAENFSAIRTVNRSSQSACSQFLPLNNLTFQFIDRNGEESEGLFWLSLIQMDISHIGCQITPENIGEAVRPGVYKLAFTQDGLLDDQNSAILHLGKNLGGFTVNEYSTRSDFGIQPNDSFFEITDAAAGAQVNDSTYQIILSGEFRAEFFNHFDDRPGRRPLTGVPGEGDFRLAGQIIIPD